MTNLNQCSQRLYKRGKNNYLLCAKHKTNHTVLLYFNNSGRLPIEIDLNEMPNSVMKFKSVRDHEIPPPIPPKTIQQDNPLPILMPKLHSQRL